MEQPSPGADEKEIVTSEQQPFGTTYASNYDFMYAEKDYQAECDLLEALFAQHAAGKVHSILDLGCGTGNHAHPLAGRGYAVTGVDRSAEMLGKARAKLGNQVGPRFVQGEIQKLDLGDQFDVVLMMFAVMGYLASDQDLEQGLQAVRKHLRPDGLYVADFWYGPAVLAIGPSVRSMRLSTPQGEMIRTATPALDPDHNRVTVHYQLTASDGELRAEESHTMRYFFRDELALRLGEAGIELITLLPFPEMAGSPDETTWNALLCARAK